MFGSFFDPFGYVNGYDRRPATQAHTRQPRPTRSLLDDFDPFGSPYPFRPANTRYGRSDSDSSSDSDRQDPGMRRGAGYPQRGVMGGYNGYGDNDEEEAAAQRMQRARQEQERQRLQRQKEELQHQQKLMEQQLEQEQQRREEQKREEDLLNLQRHREISNKRRKAQMERAQKQNQIRKQQEMEMASSEAAKGTDASAAKKTTTQSKETAGKTETVKSVPHTLLRTKKSYIIAANIPGYPADAVQISASSDHVTVTLHHVHLTLPDAEPVEGYPALDTIVGRSVDNTFEIHLPTPISIDDSDATLSGGRLLINLPFMTEEEMVKEKEELAEETVSAQAAMSQYNKNFSDDAEDWTGILKGLGGDKGEIKKVGTVQATLVPITTL